MPIVQPGQLPGAGGPGEGPYLHWALVLVPADAIALYRGFASVPEAVITNPKSALDLYQIYRRVTGNMAYFATRPGDVEILIMLWKVIRTYVPLQLRLFVEQCAFDVGGPWGRIVTGFRPVDLGGASAPSVWEESQTGQTRVPSKGEKSPQDIRREKQEAYWRARGGRKTGRKSG